MPSLSVGPSYYKHDGTDQSTDGTIILDDKHAFAAGGGATFNFAVTDAIFQPLAARQVLAAREWDLQAARNDALLAVASAYFDVQQARGNLAAALDAVEQGRRAGRQDRRDLPAAWSRKSRSIAPGPCCSTCGRR